jgi:DNA-binding GntR family transcriptional regulator
MQNARHATDSWRGLNVAVAVDPVEPVELLAARAYQRIRDAILTNRLLPGERLSVPELARQMNISRSPVREAVQRLVHDGLAVNVPHRGAVVASVDLEDLRHLYAVREVLEGLAARLAALRADPTRLARLGMILEQHERVVSDGDGGPAHVEFDIRYHQAISELSGNPHLQTMLGRIQGRAHLARHSLWSGTGAPGIAVQEHRRIFEALVARDPEAAERAARDHVVGVLDRLSRIEPTAASEPAEPPPPGEATP